MDIYCGYAVEFFNGIYCLLWGRVWMEVLFAASSSEEIWPAKGRADLRSSMGAVASAAGFLLLCDAGVWFAHDCESDY